MSAPDRITLVLRAVEGGSLDHVLPFVQLGAHVSAGRGLAVIAGASQGDLQADLQRQTELHYQALGCHPLLAAHAREMLELLERINVKCGGLDAVLAHGASPSERMWQESREAMESIGPLLDKLAPGIANTSQPAFSIDEHARMAADARRYRWLRDFERVIDAGEDLVAGCGFRCVYGEQLDQQIDEEIRQSIAEQQP